MRFSGHRHALGRKTVFLEKVFQLPGVAKSWVIPIPRRDRALRVGFRWESWCRMGPRRYKIVAAPTFVEDLARATGRSEDDAKESLRGMGVETLGDLRAVDERESRS